jgi:cytochrome P450
VTERAATGSAVAQDLMRQVISPANRHDPYPLYARLRENRVNVLPDGSFAIGRYADVVALFHDPRLSSDPHNASDPRSVRLDENASFIRRDPPEHDRLRAIANRYFGPPVSPGVITDLEPAIRRFVDGLVDSLPASGEADLVDQFAYPLPVWVITGLLGVPREDEPTFRAWTRALVASVDAEQQEEAEKLIRERDKSEAAMTGYMLELVRRHRAHPDGSMLSKLVNDHQGDTMSEAELARTGQLLLIAGHETTVNLTANGVLTLLRNPWALDRLRAEPGWVVPVVEELLRFEPPVQYLPNRFARANIAIDGTTIPKGARVYLLLAAANRDPERFPRPDCFDPDRFDSGGFGPHGEGYAHIGFGSGVHYCYGAPLARVEACVSLAAFARRFVNPRLEADPPPYRPSPALRGPIHLPVAYDKLIGS